MEPAFDPEAVRWTPVSPRLASLRRLLLVVLVTIAAALVGAALALTAGWGAALGVAAAALAVVALGWRAIGAGVRSWGYTERAEDLLVRRGVLYRRLVVVPYGRMQFVDVQAGPLDRAFGLARVQLHTAAATTDAHIPGLVPEEAARLRDRLAAFGEAQSAGL